MFFIYLTRYEDIETNSVDTQKHIFCNNSKTLPLCHTRKIDQ